MLFQIIPLVETLPGGVSIGNQFTFIGTTPLNANRLKLYSTNLNLLAIATHIHYL